MCLLTELGACLQPLCDPESSFAGLCYCRQDEWSRFTQWNPDSFMNLNMWCSKVHECTWIRSLILVKIHPLKIVKKMILYRFSFSYSFTPIVILNSQPHSIIGWVHTIQVLAVLPAPFYITYACGELQCTALLSFARYAIFWCSFSIQTRKVVIKNLNGRDEFFSCAVDYLERTLICCGASCMQTVSVLFLEQLWLVFVCMSCAFTNHR